MTHTTTITPGTRHQVICPHCGPVASANDRAVAELLGRLHAAAFALAATVEVTP